MTIEQLEQGNEICKKIEELKEFKTAFDSCGLASKAVSKVIVVKIYKKLLKIEKDEQLNLNKFPDLCDLISGYISGKIADLENQLEEL